MEFFHILWLNPMQCIGFPYQCTQIQCTATDYSWTRCSASSSRILSRRPRCTASSCLIKQEKSMPYIEFYWKYTRIICTASSCIESIWEPTTSSCLLVCLGQRTPSSEFSICATTSSNITRWTASSSLSLVRTQCSVSSSQCFFSIC